MTAGLARPGPAGVPDGENGGGDRRLGHTRPRRNTRDGRRAVMNRVGLALAAVVFLVGLSGPWTPGEAQGTIPTEAQRREGERNGGYWGTAAGLCQGGGEPGVGPRAPGVRGDRKSTRLNSRHPV